MYLTPLKEISTGSAAAGVSYSHTIIKSEGIVRLDHIFIHFSASVSPTITITNNSGDGAAYDTVLKVSTLSSATDFSWAPDGEIVFHPGDAIQVVISAVAATYGMTINAKGK